MKILLLSKRKLILTSIGVFIILLLVLFLLSSPNYLVSSVSAQHRLVPIYEVATEENVVAISFDASWGAEYTLHILDILDQYQVKTTFFLVNIWLEDYPDLAAEIVARGHEIGLHSVSHPHFTELSDEQIITELTENAAAIKEITGFSPCLFRPPFGDYNNRVIELTQSCGYIPIQWSVDSLDWYDLSADEIVSRVMKKMSAGDIVLFHNNGLHTAEALPTILEQAAACGLRVIPISELLLKDDYYIDTAGVQRRK